MGFFCPTCGEEQLVPPFVVTGQGPCPHCGTTVDLTNAIRDPDQALAIRERHESGIFDDKPPFLSKTNCEGVSEIDLFDSLATEPQLDMSPADALVIVGVCACMADGNMGPEEIQRISYLTVTSPLCGGIHNVNIEKIAHYIGKRGIAESLEEASSMLSETLKETAFLWAVELVSADGGVSPEEKTFLNDLMDKFSIDQKTVKKIVEVAKIRYRTQ
jgi:tellurite resistance protein